MLSLTACGEGGSVVGTGDDSATLAGEPSEPSEPAGPTGTPTGEPTPGAAAAPGELAADPAEPDTDTSVFAPLPSDLSEELAIYKQQGYADDDVVRIDLRTVISPGPCTEDDESGCTLADIIADTNSDDRFKPDIDVHFSADDFADDGSVSNAELRQRGGFTRFAPQKSFRIELDDKDTLWRGERRLLLNKHPYENARVRNALAMELFADMPHLFGFRTQFANLWLDDGAGATDYGLFTQIEEPGKRWLKRRGLDKDGRLYKPELFRFAEIERDALRVDASGEPLDEKDFENFLEIEAGDDHRALTTMMDALHDPTRSFDSVLDQHFNRNNLQAWLAANILLHQIEAVTHNFVLFNPAGTERFYFVPWDYDATFAIEQEPDPSATDNDALRARLRYGYARNVDNVVIRRFLQLPGAHERMLAAADLLRERYLTPAAVSDRADAMASVVAPWLQRAPDNAHLANYDPMPGARFLASIDGNADALRSRFAVPMPPALLEPTLAAGQWTFAWTPAFDVTGGTLTYDLSISSTPQFSPDDILVSLTGIADSAGTLQQSVASASLGSGRRYVRVIARSDRDPQRFWQVTDNVVEQGDTDWIGMRAFDTP